MLHMCTYVVTLHCSLLGSTVVLQECRFKALLMGLITWGSAQIYTVSQKEISPSFTLIITGCAFWPNAPEVTLESIIPSFELALVPGRREEHKRRKSKHYTDSMSLHSAPGTQTQPNVLEPVSFPRSHKRPPARPFSFFLFPHKHPVSPPSLLSSQGNRRRQTGGRMDGWLFWMLKCFPSRALVWRQMSTKTTILSAWKRLAGASLCNNSGLFQHHTARVLFIFNKVSVWVMECKGVKKVGVKVWWMMLLVALNATESSPN